MNKIHMPARAPNKRTFVKLGAVVTAAMLGVGAFSLVDTASADGYYEFGNWTKTETTETTKTAERPADPDGQYGKNNPQNTQRWVLQEKETTPGIQQHPDRSEDPPAKSVPADPEGARVKGEWTPVDGSGEPVFEDVDVLVGTEVFNMRGNPRLAPGETPAPDHEDWSPTPIPGALPAHARNQDVSDLAPGESIIYNVSEGNSGNASWFKISGVYETETIQTGETFLWQRDIATSEWTWVLQTREVTQTPPVLHGEYCVVCDDAYCDGCVKDGDGNVTMELRSSYLVRVPYNGGSPEEPGGAVDTEEFTPEAWNWNRAIEAIRDNSPDVEVPVDANEGRPFEQAGNGGGNSSYFLFVTVDGDAYRADSSVLTILLPGGGQVQLRNVQGNTWVVVPG